ncbi:recombinase family protein [Streptomyces achromogenes]|uniref:recombinase family protein n=1 Tax=Streptomyces achromogenes TaxID=67255 RepID=UPI00371D91D4
MYVEKFGTREKIRPEYNAALADLRPADSLTVTMLDRLGRTMIDLITSTQDVAERDHRLEILSGSLAGVYDPQGAGKVLFVMFAAMAETERECIHERTLIGLDTAAANATTVAARRPSTATCSPSRSGATTPTSRSSRSPGTPASAAPPSTGRCARTTKPPESCSPW